MPTQDGSMTGLLQGLITAFGGTNPSGGGIDALYTDLIAAVTTYTNSGVQGPQGHQGFQGFQGNQGAQGAQGPQGAQGAQGA